MKFKYSVIGDNTQENREWLEKVGYKILLSAKNGKWNLLYAASCGDVLGVSYCPLMALDCTHSDELFRAVVAMREDSDYMQWFITDFSNKLIPTEPIYLCETKCFNGVLIPYHRSIPIHEDGFHIGSGGFHKATLTELKERFKEKER